MGNFIIINKNQFKESADSVTFDIPSMSEKKGFLVWFEGEFKAYVNECRHMEVCLDWQPNDFFDEDKSELIDCGDDEIDSVNIKKNILKL